MKIVAFLARRPGLVVLQSLLQNPDVEIAAVFTHGSLPKAEGRTDRPEAEVFRELAERTHAAFHVVDGATAKDVHDLLPTEPLDVLLSLSWRYLIPRRVIDRFSLGGVNLHRGALPAYAGAIPVQRAIEAGEKFVAITAHVMTEEVDAGREIARVWLPIAPYLDTDRPENIAEVVKTRLEPLYAPLAQMALATL